MMQDTSIMGGRGLHMVAAGNSDTTIGVEIHEINSDGTITFISDSGGFGVRANDFTLGNGSHGLAWSPNNSVIIMFMDNVVYAIKVDPMGVVLSAYTSLFIDNEVVGISFSESGDFVFIAHSASPYVSAYNWDDVSGFGVRVTNPAALPGACNSVVQLGDKVYVGADTDVVYSYVWDDVTGWGGRTTSTGVGGDAGNVSVAPDRSGLIATDLSLNVRRSYCTLLDASGGFGAVQSDPSVSNMSYMPTSTDFSTRGYHCLISGGDATPRVNIFTWSATTGTGTLLSQPSGLSGDSGYAKCAKWSRNDEFILAVNLTKLSVWAWSGTATGAEVVNTLNNSSLHIAVSN